MKRLVVGIDGSPAAGNALRWAVAHLQLNGVIDAVHAVSPGAEVALGLRQHERRRLLDSARTDLETVWTDPARSAGSTVHGHVLDQTPADALVSIAEDEHADAIVVGSHGSGRISANVLGHVTRRLLHDAPVPVVVVGERTAGPSASSEPVVVGVDDQTSRPAVRWAGRFAAERRRPLVLAHSISRRPLFVREGIEEAPTWHIDPALAHQFAEDDLATIAEDLRSAHGDDLDVSINLSSGSASRTLADLGSSASTLVLGKARDHPLAESLIGPVVHHVLTHGACPIIVVPSSYGG